MGIIRKLGWVVGVLVVLPTAAYAPTTEAQQVRQQQWADAVRFARQYRPTLGPDSLRLTDSLAFEIVRAADHHGIVRAVAFRLVFVESRFKITARGQLGEVGLTQIMPRTGARVCGLRRAAQLQLPRNNLNCGMKYLRQLFDHYDGNWQLALTAYNGGPDRADQVRRLTAYADRVLGS